MLFALFTYVFYASGYIFFVTSVVGVGEKMDKDGTHMSFSYFLGPCVARLTRNGFRPLPFLGSSFVLYFGCFMIVLWHLPSICVSRV